MKMRMTLLALVGIGALSCGGQSFTIDWFTLDGGGGVSTGGVYTVAGTAGQPEAGFMSGGEFTLVGGFWSLVSVPPPEAAPWLTVACTRTNSVIISWPAAGFVLQENARLGTTDWSPVGVPLVETNGWKQLILTTPVGNRFYRLKYHP